MRTDNFRRWYLLPLGALLWNELVFYGGRLLARGLPHTDMTTALDRLIPQLPWTVAIYFGCFLFWALNYCLCARMERRRALAFFGADFLVKAVCLAFFLALPTQMSRPQPDGTGFWDAALRFLYLIDEPNNLFPSIHCAVSWLSWAGLRDRQELPAWYRSLSLLLALAVVFATLTTKQHVLADAAAGIALAEAAWQLALALSRRKASRA